MIDLKIRFYEESYGVITVTFYDENGNSVIPNSLTWTLTDDAGTVINSRTDVAVSTPAASNSITLSGNDLQITGASDTKIRYILFEGTLNSSAGNNLPFKEVGRFEVEDVFTVT